MAELILRPVSDSTLAHSCSSGSSGWALINEATADDDAGYIYQNISDTSSSSQTSVFKVCGSVSNKIRISSLNLVIRGRTTKGNDKDTATLAYNVYFNGVEGSSGSGTFSTSYGNFSKTYNASDFGLASTVFDSFDAANIVVHVQTIGKKNASKNDDFQNRVTQVYITATYEEISNPIYACSAVAGEGIQSTSVSASSVVSGESCTFTAALKSNYNIFDGWYSDSGCTNLVSTANPYTTAITADTTLYAKASRSQFTMAVGSAEHGTASVSSATVLYGDSVTYTFTPEDDTWELYGWYSDSGLTTLVSEANPYTFTAAANLTLYPKVGLKRYTITFTNVTHVLLDDTITFKAAVFLPNSLTKAELRCLKTGEFDKVDASKLLDSSSKSTLAMVGASISVIAPINANVILWAYTTASKTLTFIANDTYYANGARFNSSMVVSPHAYYVFTPQKDIQYKVGRTTIPCYCTAIAKEGINYAEATSPTLQGYSAIFEAEASEGYAFDGWYSDEECTIVVSTDNSASIITPKDASSNYGTQTSLTLYAKAQKVAEATGIYLKQNGAYKQATAVYKKVNGVWVQQTDIAALKTEMQSGKYKVST